MNEMASQIAPAGKFFSLSKLFGRLSPEERKAVAQLEGAIRQLEAQRPEASDATVADVCRHCIAVVDTTALLLGLLTTGDVSLSVKLLWRAEDAADPVVHTLFRSTRTKTERQGYAPTDLFSFRLNTAFRRLVEERDVLPVFASNNLIELFAAGQYDNANFSWTSFYATTSVAPIPAAGKDHEELIGFLCADSPSAQLQDERVAQVLKVAAAHIYETLRYDLFAPELRDAKGSHANFPRIGWVWSEQKLEPVDDSTQSAFQHVMLEVEKVYRTMFPFTGGALAAPSGRRQGHSQTERAEMDDEESEWLRGLAKEHGGTLPGTLLTVGRKLTPEQEERVLSRMSAYDPEGADLMRKSKVR